MTPWDSQGNRIISFDGIAQTLRTHESGGNWSGNVYVPDKARSLTARNDGSPCVDRGPEVVATFQNTGRGWWNKSPIAQTLRTPCGGDSTKANLVAAGFKLGNGEKANSIGYEREKAPTLSAMDSGNKPAVAVYDMTHADEVMRKVPDGRAPTLNARMGTGGNQVPVVAYSISHDFRSSRFIQNQADPLTATDYKEPPVVHSYSIAGNIIGREDKNGGHHMGVDKDVSFTLNTADRHAVYAMQRSDEWKESQVSHTLAARDYKDATDLVAGKSVRRLTPTECERLQGLPDGYTNVPCNGKSASDTQRYKALGNGMAQPCADYVIRRIAEVCNGEV